MCVRQQFQPHIFHKIRFRLFLSYIWRIFQNIFQFFFQTLFFPNKNHKKAMFCSKKHSRLSSTALYAHLYKSKNLKLWVQHCFTQTLFLFLDWFLFFITKKKNVDNCQKTKYVKYRIRRILKIYWLRFAQLRTKNIPKHVQYTKQSVLFFEKCFLRFIPVFGRVDAK